MPKKSARLDAFVDESIRGQTYYVCAVLVPFERQSLLRKELRELASGTGRRRLHFHSASKRVRQLALEQISDHVTGILVVKSQMSHGQKEESTRQELIRGLVLQLQITGVRRVTIESRSDNSADAKTFVRTRHNGPHIDFLHLGPQQEEILWAADAVAWSIGAGQMWRRQLEQMGIIEISITP
jgi:hypothetical protein